MLPKTEKNQLPLSKNKKKTIIYFNFAPHYFFKLISENTFLSPTELICKCFLYIIL